MEPLTPRHAEEMTGVLAAPELYRFTGGAPPTSVELQERYRCQASGSPDPAVEWRNWVLRQRGSQVAVGYIQATVTDLALRERVAEVAWVVGLPWQGRGFAVEAATWLLGEVEWLGASVAVAHIATANRASEAVARRIGMVPGDVREDGERVWIAALLSATRRPG